MIEIIEPNAISKKLTVLNIVPSVQKKAYPDLDEIKCKLKNLRKNAIEDSEKLINQFANVLTKKGITVYAAETSKQAAEYVLKIAEKNAIKNIHLNRSLVAEKIKNEIIKTEHVNFIDTYVNSLQIRKTPTIKYFSELTYMPEKKAFEGLRVNAKKIKNFNYKQSISESYLGLLGVTSASADGCLIYLQHLENISDILNGAKVLIHIVPIEKIVEDRNAAFFEAICCGAFGFKTVSLDVNALAGSITIMDAKSNQHETEKFTQLEQPKENYVIILDDGRKKVSKSFKELLYCISCKACWFICPWAQLHPRERYATPRDFCIKEANFMTHDLYQCCLCNACKIYCPLEIDLPSINLEMRSQIVEQGYPPKNVKDALISTYRYGNPWNMPQVKSEEWCKSLEIKKAREEKSETLLFTCCALAFEPRLQEIVKSLASMLKKIEIDFCILGNEAKCCGEHILGLGEKGLFEELRDHNTSIINKYGIRQIITISPHCYNAFKHNYPGLNNVKIKHYTEFLLDIFKEKNNIRLSERVRKVVYHDPCLLGRYNNIYEEPRKLLALIPGTKLLELPRSRKDSLCCGGGGGRYWVEESREERISVNRASEIVNVNPNVVATSCPFCNLMLTDAFKIIDQEHIQVKDIIELFNEALIDNAVSP